MNDWLGRFGEELFLVALETIGIRGERIPLSGAGARKGDILLPSGLKVEVKTTRMADISQAAGRAKASIRRYRDMVGVVVQILDRPDGDVECMLWLVSPDGQREPPEDFLRGSEAVVQFPDGEFRRVVFSFSRSLLERLKGADGNSRNPKNPFKGGLR